MNDVLITYPAGLREQITERTTGAPVRRCAGLRPDRDALARRGRTRKQWKSAILAYFDTDGASNGPAEAINGVIETTRRIARSFRSFTNYRLRCLLAVGGHRPYRNKQANHA